MKTPTPLTDSEISQIRAQAWGFNHADREQNLVRAIESAVTQKWQEMLKQEPTRLPSDAFCEERIKTLMAQCGLPDSRSLYQAFKQFQNDMEHAFTTAPQPAQQCEKVPTHLRKNYNDWKNP